MIDYNQIQEELKDENVFRLLEQLGAQPIDKGDYFICRTVCHNESVEDASQKLYYYKNTHIFYCYTECGGMNIFSFLKNYYEARSIAYDWYQDVLQVVLSCSARDLVGVQTYRPSRGNYEAQKVRKELPAYPDGILDVFTKHYPIEWFLDGISKEAMDKYNILYSISQNKIIIPHYDINNRLVGIRGRALNPYEVENFGKYMPVQIEGKWYSHPLSLNLYGLNKNWKNIKEDGIAFIFESEKSVLQCESFEMKNYGVACCGSNINKFQIDLLMRYCAPKYITICFDREEKESETKYFDKLYKMCQKYSAYCNMSFVYDREGITNMKDSPSDKGETKFRKLIDERVRVK